MEMTAINGTALPIPGLPSAAHPAGGAEQLVLIGEPQPIRVPERRWRSWLDDPVVVARFEAKRYKRADDLCWSGLAGYLRQVTGRSAPRAWPAPLDAAPSPRTSSPTNWRTA
jgi:hypothetical protein